MMITTGDDDDHHWSSRGGESVVRLLYITSIRKGSQRLWPYSMMSISEGGLIHGGVSFWTPGGGAGAAHLVKGAYCCLVIRLCCLWPTHCGRGRVSRRMSTFERGNLLLGSGHIHVSGGRLHKESYVEMSGSGFLPRGASCRRTGGCRTLHVAHP